ncbi:hypothetical protein BE17_09270 [Sorangium cellulosum]|uniref:Secreted protein n=1 Tax=Sorangium cellulosum TaxID=56 RepID=A0A150SGW8_SORCE|nr:hypothetical protein BE17_09270 [Sorangium cellulosum]
MRILFRSKRHILCATLLSISGGLLAGCALDSEAGDPELIEEAEAAFGEATCSTTTSGFISDHSDIGCWESTTVASGNATYGTTSCTDAFIVDLDGSYVTETRAQPVIGNPADADNYYRCIAIKAQAIRYPASGGLPQQKLVHGVWNSSMNQCRLLLDFDNAFPTFNVATGDRFILRAYDYFNSPATKIRVGLDIIGPEC